MFYLYSVHFHLTIAFTEYNQIFIKNIYEIKKLTIIEIVFKENRIPNKTDRFLDLT